MRVRFPWLERIGMVTCGVAIWALTLVLADPYWLSQSSFERLEWVLVISGIAAVADALVLAYRMDDRSGVDPILSYVLTLLKTGLKFAVGGMFFPIVVFMVKNPNRRETSVTYDVGTGALPDCERARRMRMHQPHENAKAPRRFMPWQLICSHLVMSVFAMMEVFLLMHELELNSFGLILSGISAFVSFYIIIELWVKIWMTRKAAYMWVCFLMGLDAALTFLHGPSRDSLEVQLFFGILLTVIVLLTVWIYKSKTVKRWLDRERERCASCRGGIGSESSGGD